MIKLGSRKEYIQAHKLNNRPSLEMDQIIVQDLIWLALNLGLLVSINHLKFDPETKSNK